MRIYLLHLSKLLDRAQFAFHPRFRPRYGRNLNHEQHGEGNANQHRGALMLQQEGDGSEKCSTFNGTAPQSHLFDTLP